MLLWLAQYLQDYIGPMRVFNFITFRAVFATITATALGLFTGPAVIRKLTEMKVGQAVRTQGPQTHLKKHGTPTMGGVLILISIAISTLLWCDLSNRLIWPVLIVTLGFGAVGWVDDYRKVVYQDPEGMRSREKYFWMSLVGLTASLYL
ncbi:MAG: phospho-N-acetylmuramoyl-pentapeptide-transferase, partial [Telluria sp.]